MSNLCLPVCTLLFLIIIITTETHGKQSFYMEPDNVTVNPEDNVKLTCKVSNREGSCGWLKDFLNVGKIPSKYLFSSEPSDGDCSIQIINAHLAHDDGFWQCQVTAAQIGEVTLTSKNVKLTVRQKPLPPQLQNKNEFRKNGDALKVRINEAQTFECISRKGNPPAVIKWFIDDVDVTERSVQTNGSELENPKLFRAVSAFTYSFGKEHNMRTLKCSALHDMYPEKSLAVQVYLDVMYPPTVSIEKMPEEDIIENTLIEVRCMADANPEASVMWKKSGHANYIQVDERLPFPNVTVNREDSGVYICTAKNPMGQSEGLEVNIDVKYAPKIISVKPSFNQTVFIGKMTNFTCTAEGNPPPEYHWIQKWDTNPPRIQQRSQTAQLLVKNTTYDYQGKYVCLVRNRIAGKEKNDQSAEISLDVKGPPQVMNESGRTKQKVVVEEEENAKLVVTFCSDPPPRNTYWEWGSLKLQSGAIRGKFKAERLLKDQGYNDCFEARLNIEKAIGSDSRKYTLNVENRLGNTAYAVSLEIKEPVAVSMVIGIVVGCVLLLAIGILILIYALKTEKFCFKRSGTHDFKTDTDSLAISEMGAGNTDTARTNASGAIPPDAVYTAPSMVVTPTPSAAASSNGHADNSSHYENVRPDREERRNREGLVYADLDMKPMDRRGMGPEGRFRGSGSKPKNSRPQREPIEYAEIQFQPKLTERADL